MTPDGIMRRVRGGRPHPLHRGVHPVGHANPPREAWLLAAVRACGGTAALSHRAQGAHLEIIEWEDRYPDVLVLGERAPRHPRISGHRTSYLPRDHVMTWRGIPGTTAERTLLDLVLRDGFAHPLVNELLFLGGRRVVPDLLW